MPFINGQLVVSTEASNFLCDGIRTQAPLHSTFVQKRFDTSSKRIEEEAERAPCAGEVGCGRGAGDGRVGIKAGEGERGVVVRIPGRAASKSGVRRHGEV